MTFNLSTYLKEHQAHVNHSLEHLFDSFDGKRELIMAMKHSLMAGGKRLRPILAIASAQACGRDFAPALPACCAIEMIHTYSLIHDDLPGMDDDDQRRGLPTCHKKFSEATAILAGDALLTQAFDILSNPAHVFETFPEPEIRIELISQISRAAGTNGMVEGQMMDMQAHSDSFKAPLEHLKKIHALKTGKMITVSVKAGALSVAGDKTKLEMLVDYADNIGLAFQVADDILNVEGDPKIMGKAAGSDELNDKMTFPAIIGLEASKQYAESLVQKAIKAISEFDEKADPLRGIAEYIINRDR